MPSVSCSRMLLTTNGPFIPLRNFGVLSSRAVNSCFNQKRQTNLYSGGYFSKYSQFSPLPVRNFSSLPNKEDQREKISQPEEEEETIEDFIKNRRSKETAEIRLEKSYLAKLKLKSGFVKRDLTEFFENIKKLEFMMILWKNQQFMKRNFKRFKLILRHLWIEIKKIGRGMRALYQDVQYSIKTTKDTEMKEYGSYSFQSRVKIRQTWADVFKFIPFSVLILIPGLEALIPFYLVIFPNAMPSQFQSEGGKEKKLKELVELQTRSADKLSKIFPQRLSDALKEREIDLDDKEKIKELRRIFKENDCLTTDLLAYRKIFQVYINFRYAPTKVLMTICNMMSLQPITGLNTINNLLKFFKLEIPIDHPSVEWMTRRFLFREYSLYMKKLRRDDSYLKFEEIEELDEPTLNRLCFERGLPVSILGRNQKLRELKKWHTLSNLRNVPHSLLIYLRVMKFGNIKKYHDHFLSEYHILRRCENEIYYYEKKRMFEETLAVDDLRSLVGSINENLKSNQNEVKFSAEDLDNYSAFLNRLTDRFSQLDTEVQNTYIHSSNILDYMENKLIVEYLLEGKQKELEEEAPELAEKAKDIFGNEFYYSLPVDQAIEEDSKWFAKLDQRRQEIETKFGNKFSEEDLQKLVAQ